MKVLVTGSSGFIGRWVVADLVAAGHRVIGLDIKPDAAPGCEIHEVCDLVHREALMRAVARHAPDAIIHLAARTDLKETQDISGYAANIEGVQNLVDAVQATPSCRRVIYTSTQLVCRIGHVPTSDTDYCPTTLYGESKVQTETIVRTSDGGGATWCLVRPTTVWGPGMSPHYQLMLRLIQGGWYFHAGNGRLMKSYGYVANVARQLRCLIEGDGAKIHRRTLFVADAEPISLRLFADRLAAALGARPIWTMPLTLARLLAAIGDALERVGIHALRYNSFRLRNILTEYKVDVSPVIALCGKGPVTFDEGIARTAAWFKGLANP